MNQYIHGNAVVKIHGAANQGKVKDAAEKFLKKAERKKKNAIQN